MQGARLQAVGEAAVGEAEGAAAWPGVQELVACKTGKITPTASAAFRSSVCPRDTKSSYSSHCQMGPLISKQAPALVRCSASKAKCQ